MKRVFVLLALVGIAVYATTAWSASGPTPTEQRLLKDVATLKTQVKTLQKQVKNLGANTLNAVGTLAILSVCSAELTTDALQGTWQIVDQIATGLQESPGKTYFGAQSPVVTTINGQDWCALANVTRSQVLPPTVAQFLALLAPFHASNLALGTARFSFQGGHLHLK